MKLHLATLLITLTSFTTPVVYAQTHENAVEAFALSAKKQQPVMLVFSGSDWCAPCIKFEKEILSTEIFRAFAEANLILLKVDFPQRKLLPDAIRIQNDQLAEKYNPDGIFPQILLIYPDNSQRIAQMLYSQQTASEFVAEISTNLRHEQRAASK